MEHFYQNLGENWFSYPSLYKKMVEQFPNGSHFVEIGTWKGMSACFMAVEIINSGKNIKFDCVDIWEYIENSNDIDKNLYCNLFNVFTKNIESVKDYINIVRSVSWEAAEKYQDASLDFVFIDAGHDYDSVKKDINSWFPKIKIGGVIAGHDYHNNGNCKVKMAIDQFFENKGKVNEFLDCWIYEKHS